MRRAAPSCTTRLLGGVEGLFLFGATVSHWKGEIQVKVFALLSSEDYIDGFALLSSEDYW